MSNKLEGVLISNLIYFARIVLVWIIALFFLLAFQIETTDTISYSRVDEFKNVFLSGIFTGLIWGIIFRIARLFSHKIPTYSLSVLVSIAVNISSAYILIYCMYHLPEIFNLNRFPNNFHQLLELYNSRLFFAILAYFFIVGTLIEIFHDIDKKFGKGVLLKILMGKYYKPKEEERIFLFMDLKSSTYYAEKLGHFMYSRLIQDCFKDISAAVLKNHAEIYQFVGDEVVLTWKLKNGLEKSRCLQMFYDFVNTIETRKDYYQKQYGMIPVFKAGVHSGKVMVAEVGELKSEIAYHGDAINTASRIQGLCNSYNCRLLVSGDLMEELKKKNTINGKHTYIGHVLLTGKEIETDLYSMSLN